MNQHENLQTQVFAAVRDQGISSVVFRNAISRRLGLNATDFECLSLISINGISTPKKLASHTGLSTGSTTALLDRLERAGFIRRKPNPQDRRGVIIELSEQWQQKAGPLVAGVQQAHRTLIAHYSDDELKTIADFLNGFTANVRDHTEQLNKYSA
jgi:DNA-binding MarR family transcriptional regulator